MFAHITLVALLYALLTVVRAPTVWGIGARKDGSNPWKNIEPRINANLKNQFEWPLFFYIACMLLIIQGNMISTVHIWLSWIFIVGRLTHSYIHIFTSNIRLRGAVFTINFVAVLGIWILLLMAKSVL
jgi:hypothetical protein